MIRWGILGAGNIAHRFAASLQNEIDSQLYAIAVRKEEKAIKFKEQYPFEVYYLDYQQLIDDENVDAIYLSLPQGLHSYWAIKALQAHKPVLCEKPAVVKAEEMRQIAQTSKENQTLFMEAMKQRFVPMYSKIKKIISSGTLGTIQAINTQICFPIIDPNHPEQDFGKTYHSQPDQGGCLLDSGTYCVSWFDDFMKCPLEVTQAKADLYNDVDIYVEAFLTDGNCQAKVEVAFDRYSPRDAEIIGSKGKMHVYNLHRPEKIDLSIGNKTETICIPYDHDDFYSQIHHFVTLLKNGQTESNIMTLENSIHCAEMLDAIRAKFMKDKNS